MTTWIAVNLASPIRTESDDSCGEGLGTGLVVYLTDVR